MSKPRVATSSAMQLAAALLIIYLFQPKLSANIPILRWDLAVCISAIAGFMLAMIFAPAGSRLLSRLSLKVLISIMLCGASEEILWRGALQNTIWPNSAELALTVSILGFGLLHYRRSQYREVFFFSVLGACFAFSDVYGGVVAAMAMHVSYNAVIASLIQRHMHRPSV